MDSRGIEAMLRSLAYLVSAFVRRRRIVVVELPMLGELPYILPILSELTRSPECAVILSCGNFRDDFSRLGLHLPADIAARSRVIDARFLRFLDGFVDLFITSEQFSSSCPRCYSICIFHGQPSKGITFTRDVLERFDLFFFIGPLHRAALERCLQREHRSLRHLPEIVEAGYPKLDSLLNGAFERNMVFSRLGLSPGFKTVLYAPAFNEYATLRTIGPQLIESLTGIDGLNVIIKLAPDSINSSSNFYATGGVNWREELKRFESDRCRIADDLDINPYLEVADLMVTDVSGVSYDFLILGKPVIFYDCPDFYGRYLPRYNVGLTVEECLADDSVNAGRNYGTVVHSLEELGHRVVNCLFDDYEAYRPLSGLKERFLYNPGKATDVSMGKIRHLLASGVVSRRPAPPIRFVSRLRGAVQRFLFSPARNAAVRCLSHFGYRLTRSGLGYIDADETVREAQRAGLTVCEYLESRETDERKQGRRNRIVDTLEGLGVFQNCSRVCEIGAGTGMYLEKILEKRTSLEYEVYETDKGWARYLHDRFGSYPGVRLYVRNADGQTLHDTQTNSCDLVHAHGVFVYLPLLQTFDYLKEAARVCRDKGLVVFDCYLDTSFTTAIAGKWLESQWRFPVIIPEKLLLDFAAMHSLQLETTFQEVYGAAVTDYLVFRKL